MGAGDDRFAAMEAAKVANAAAKSDLDVLAHALKMKSAEYLIAKPKAKAGDVAFRAPRKVGAEFMGGMTALLYAAREGHIQSARALVESGADLKKSNGDKLTPLILSVINGHFDLAKYLLDRGANPKFASVSGLTALYAVVDVQWAPHAWYPQPTTDQEKTSYLELLKTLL